MIKVKLESNYCNQYVLIGRDLITDDCNKSQRNMIDPQSSTPKDVSTHTSKFRDTSFNGVNMFVIKYNFSHNFEIILGVSV